MASIGNLVQVVLSIVKLYHISFEIGTNKAVSSSASSAGTRISMVSIQRVIQQLQQNSVRKSTRKIYESVWRNLNNFIRRDEKPDNWEDRLILFAGHLIEQNKKSQTVRSYVSAVKGILKYDGIHLCVDKVLLWDVKKISEIKLNMVYGIPM